MDGCGRPWTAIYYYHVSSCHRFLQQTGGYDEGAVLNSNHWKQFERDCASFIGGDRYPANMGGRIDVEGPMGLAQCKLQKSLSHQQVTDLCTEMAIAATLKGKLGVLLHKVPGGRGHPTSPLISMTWEQFDAWFSMRRR